MPKLRKKLSEALSHWAEDESAWYRFCPRCGGELKPLDLGGQERRVCPKADFVQYRNPVPAVGAFVRKNSGLLLVLRKYPPRAGLWTLPAGFMEYDEAPEETAVREVKEETGLDVAVQKLFSVYRAGDDPRTRVVLILYEVEIVGGKLKPGDDALKAEFFPLDGLPEDIAFSAHRRALSEYLAREKKRK
ncbi:MAG: NUDIX domain-containing protein [Candidatus Zixiibacteriota bacterium]